MSRQPTLARPLVRASEVAMQRLSNRQRAPVWLHAGAVAQHARMMELITATGLDGALDELAALHPTLALFAALDIPDDDARIVEAHWATHALPSDGDGLRAYSYPLGDLYQTLSSEARSDRALCQTPYWVSELLLHIAYQRAREQWDNPRVIDPACGTGHILVEAFAEKIAHVGCPVSALDAICGVDLDPYAAAVTAYRLLARASVERGLVPVSALPIHVASAHSLPLLARGQYHCVIANPPYIVPKDAADREAIRERYRVVCLGRYSLALPFTVLMTELAVEGGYIAQLTTNAWMKREYGKRFVTDYLPRFELVWIINAAGAYIPGHGTPTCILVHRNLAATGEPVTTILGKRGEPSTPADPSRGLVWSSIRDAVLEHEADARVVRRGELRPIVKVRHDP